MEGKEEDENILHTLSKIPPSHANLVKGFTFKFQGGNTLDGDDEHIGYVQEDPKIIVIAAPWVYSREYVILHEIAHLVWAKFVNSQLRKEWEQIVARTKNKQNQSPEELFCMAYASTYAKHKIIIHTHEEWLNFIKRLPINFII